MSLLQEEKQQSLLKIADNYKQIYESLSSFQKTVELNHYKDINDDLKKANGVFTSELRQEQIKRLIGISELEHENAKSAEMIIK